MWIVKLALRRPYTFVVMEYARGNLNRWRELKAKNLVAQQDVDDRQMAFDASQADTDAAQANVEALGSNIVAAQANVDANKANVQRLTETQSFQSVRAPFAGVITQRTVEQGSLITSGSNSSYTPMFRLAQTDSLRILVNVPQTFMFQANRRTSGRVRVVRVLSRQSRVNAQAVCSARR